MELCSTQMAVTTGDDIASNDSLSSPKCQKCHMERIEGTVLHKWARPDLKWTLADNDHLTAEFNPDDTTVASRRKSCKRRLVKLTCILRCE